MNFLHLSLVLTLVFSQTAYTRQQRRPARAPYMTALQKNSGLGNERLLMSNRRPIAEVKSRNQIGMPNTIMAREGMPNTRVIQPKCPCQMETPCQKMPEMPTMTRMPAQYMPVPTLPVVPSAQVAPVPMAPMAIFPSIPEVAPVPMAPMAIFPSIPEVAEVSYPVPTAITETCSCREPTALVSPFLPAASPVSAFAPPTSNLLPSVMPYQARNHFLRKIPIPPPTL